MAIKTHRHAQQQPNIDRFGILQFSVELATLVQGNDFSAEKTNGIYTIKTDSIFMTVTPSYMGNALKSPYYGWHTAEKNFAIKKLDHSALILSCNDTIYTFRKF